MANFFFALRVFISWLIFLSPGLELLALFGLIWRKLGYFASASIFLFCGVLLGGFFFVLWLFTSRPFLLTSALSYFA